MHVFSTILAVLVPLYGLTWWRYLRLTPKPGHTGPQSPFRRSPADVLGDRVAMLERENAELKSRYASLEEDYSVLAEQHSALQSEREMEANAMDAQATSVSTVIGFLIAVVCLAFAFGLLVLAFTAEHTLHRQPYAVATTHSVRSWDAAAFSDASDRSAGVVIHEVMPMCLPRRSLLLFHLDERLLPIRFGRIRLCPECVLQPRWVAAPAHTRLE